jgi:hypothetical protein
MFKAISAVMGYSLAMPRMPSVPKSFPKEDLLTVVFYNNQDNFATGIKRL